MKPGAESRSFRHHAFKLSKVIQNRLSWFLPAFRYVLLAINLFIFYAYVQHALEIVLAFGKYGRACDHCPWLYRSQWHYLAVDIGGFLLIFPACWVAIGSRRPRDLGLLMIVPVVVILIHKYLSGGDWLTG